MIHPSGEIQNFMGGGMDSRWILVFGNQPHDHDDHHRRVQARDERQQRQHHHRNQPHDHDDHHRQSSEGPLVELKEL